MKYVFLTFTMRGVAGNALYVAKKMEWLKQRGWDIVVFDHYGGLEFYGKIIIDTLLPYQNNRIAELFFPPVYFTKHQRQQILDKLCSVIGVDDEYVVETHSHRLALWGELLAQNLKAKHLIFNVGEHVSLRSRQEYDFVFFKLCRNEYFTINTRVLQRMLLGYKNITEEDAQKHVFSASMGVRLVDVPLPELDKQSAHSDFTILSFGRRKPYFHNMINSVLEFANLYSQKKIHFIFLGDVKLNDIEKASLDRVPNITYQIIPPKRPVPKCVFEISNVVIATAGCANISFREGYKTISMNVENCQPLGVMGYTTINSVFDTEKDTNQCSLADLLTDVLVKKLYNRTPSLHKEYGKKGFDYQLSMVNDDRRYWKSVDAIPMDESRIRQIILSTLLRFRCLTFWERWLQIRSLLFKRNI